MDILEKFCRYVRIAKDAGKIEKGLKAQYNTYTYSCVTQFSDAGTSCAGNILSRDDRDDKLVVCFKGSVEIKDWVRDFWAWKLKWPYAKTTKDMDKVWIHAGFKNQYSSVRLKVIRELSDLMAKRGKPQHITFCGHSLGGALASISALDAHESLDPSKAITSLYSYASPRVYNTAGAGVFTSKMEYANRTSYADDIVPQVPVIDYLHVGKPVHVRQDLSVEFANYNRPIPMCKATDHFVENYVNAFRFLMNVKGMTEIFNKNIIDDPADNAKHLT